jgi:UDP-glucose 4-epimerase
MAQGEEERSAARDVTSGAVLVTGISGRLGRRLARRLHRVRKVIGIDSRRFDDRPADVEHFAIDLSRSKVRDIFRRQDVSAVVHLSVMRDPRRNAEEHHTFNVVAYQRVLEYAQQYKIPKVILLSTANVYGPRPENPQFLNEDAPLLASGAFSEMRDLVELDMLTQSFFWKEPQIETVILRPTHILGTVGNAPSNYLRLKVVPTLLGFDPMMQVVHQDDVVQAIVLALAPGVRGIFNLAGPPPIALSQALASLKRATVAVPHGFARFGMERMWRWRITSFPAPDLDFIRYVCMVDDAKARQHLTYSPEHDVEATLRAVDDERWV